FRVPLGVIQQALRFVAGPCHFSALALSTIRRRSGDVTATPAGGGHPTMDAFRTLLSRSALAVAACAVLVTLCYHFVDRPVAFFVHDHHLNQQPLLKWLTHPPMALNALAPVIAALAVVRLAWGPWTRPERTLFAASVSLMTAVAFEYYLKFLFG